MSSIRDGLGGEELQVSGLQAGGVNINPYFTGSITSESTIAGSVLRASNVSGATFSGTDFVNGEGELQSVSIGSGTAVYGAKIQAGSGALSAGSNAWIDFPVAYGANPSVNTQDMTTAEQALFVVVGSLNVGSFYVEGATASDEFSWISVGI